MVLIALQMVMFKIRYEIMNELYSGVSHLWRPFQGKGLVFFDEETLMGIPLNNEVQPRQLALHQRTGTAPLPVMGTSTTLLWVWDRIPHDKTP